jgi:sortase A
MGLRVAQYTAFALGLALLGWFLVARGQGLLASRSAVENFRRAQEGLVEVTRLDRHHSELAETSPVDTSLWSEGRIDAYRRSLVSEPRTPLAILRVPRVGIEVPVFNGSDDWVLDRGAGRIEGTASPGEPGNIGIASHRDGFFRPLKDIAVSDTVILETPHGLTWYQVVDLRIVDPSDVWVLDPTEENVITLVTCYPFYFAGSAPQRFVVRARSIAIEGREPP